MYYKYFYTVDKLTDSKFHGTNFLPVTTYVLCHAVILNGNSDPPISMCKYTVYDSHIYYLNNQLLDLTNILSCIYI